MRKKTQHLHYAGSIVLGLNDAIVELTGALSGMALAFQDTRIVAVAGLVTGIAASLSMAASEYLEVRQDVQEGNGKNPFVASAYTGVAYLCATFVLVAPFFLVQHVFQALGFTVAAAIIIIAGFTHYVSRARKQSWAREFIQMALISLGVAAISFLIAYILRQVGIAL